MRTAELQAQDLDSAIAIVGMAGRFPGARDVDELWRNVQAGHEALTRFTDEELVRNGIDRAVLADPAYVKAGQVLDDIESFDAGLFGYSPRDAQVLDPQQRLFLEQAHAVLEDANCDPTRFDGAIGVFAGSALSTYLLHNLMSNPQLAATVGVVQAVLGNDKDSLATRTAYALDLRGPCYAVQSYCSTSLVAVCQAASSLLSGECDLAIAGGVAISVPHRVGYFHQQGGMSSSDGSCRPFDARADGAPIASGVAVVALKRMEEAVASHDRIHGAIRGWAVNNDGARKAGFTAPGVRGQASVVTEALANAGLTPGDVGYIEAHGTGTRLGDATEVSALKQVFGGLPPESCAIGSIKSNLGHLDRAAGVTGLIKTTLMVRDGLMPPTLNCVEPNPELGIADSPFTINTELRRWDDEPARVAGVSAFGIGGTNAHVVVSQPPREHAPPIVAARPAQILTVSAKSTTAADHAALRLASHLEREAQPLREVAATLQTGRCEFEHRRAVVSATPEDAIARLRGDRLLSARVDVPDRPAAFLIAGVGEHHPGMARGLFEQEPVFRAAFERCADLTSRVLDVDLAATLWSRPGTTATQADPLAAMLGRNGSVTGGELARTTVAQPTMFAIEYALATLLASWGITPSAMLGYSVGEYVAACLAGVLTLEEATAVVAERARLIESLPTGAMIALPLGVEEAQDLLSPELDFAADNGPNACVVAGSEPAVRRLQATLAERSIPSALLNASHPFHSRGLAGLRRPLSAWAQEHLDPQPPEIPYVSNVTGTWITHADLRDPEYWARHACERVRFSAGIATLLSRDDVGLIEIGPGQSLGAMVRTHPACARERWSRILSTLPGQHDAADDATALSETVARAWLSGHAIDWRAYNATHPSRRVKLPTYPFERRRFWIDPPKTRPSDGGAAELHVPTWQPVDAPSRGDIDGPVLLLEDQGGVCALVADELARRDVETVALRGDGDLVALLRRLSAERRVPRTVVYAWALDTPAGLPVKRSAFMSLCDVIRELNRHGGDVRLAILSAGLHRVTSADVVVPAQALVLGPAKVAAQEYPALRCRSIDISSDVDGLAQRIADELRWDDEHEVVALRGRERLAQTFATPDASDPPALRLRAGGAYVVIGGLGGVGVTLAQHLVREVGARVALTTRGEVPPRNRWESDARYRDLAALDPVGSQIVVLTAEATDERAVRTVLDATHRRWGSVDGIFHAAADTRPESFRMIEHLDESAAANHFAAKVDGTCALERALDGLRPDFVVLMSSISTVLGGLAHASYVAANSYLDAAAAIPRGGCTRWLSICWDTWEPTAGAISAMQIGTEMRQNVLRSDAACEALARCLALGAPRVIVSAGELEERMRRWRSGRVPDTTGTRAEQHERPDLSVPYSAPDAAPECELAHVWEDLLGIHGIGANDHFFELGGTSLLGVQLIDRLKRELGVSLPVAALFEAPTVRSLAALIANNDSTDLEEELAVAASHDKEDSR
jgi:acyl transferase domain-containing protein/acyl carrier protein